METVNTRGSVRERVLHAVAVMRVQIDVEHALEARVEQREDREHRVVEVAEAARAIGPAMVRAAGRVIRDATGERKARRVHRAAHARRGTLEEALEQRILHGAETVTLADLAVHLAVRAGVAQRLDVIAAVEARELVLGRARTRVEFAWAEPAERLAEVHHRTDARDAERMMAGVARAPVHVVADEGGREARRAHVGQLGRS